VCVCVCVGITKKTQVIKGELNPVWNEVRRATYFLFMMCVADILV